MGGPGRVEHRLVVAVDPGPGSSSGNYYDDRPIIRIRCVACGVTDEWHPNIYNRCPNVGTEILVPLGRVGESEEVKTALALATLHLLGKGGEKPEGT